MAINIKKSIRVCCAIRDMNQTTLAEASGLKQSHISYISSQNTCSLETINKLAKALNYTSAEFIEWGESD